MTVIVVVTMSEYLVTMVVTVVLGMTVKVLLLLKMNVFLIQTRKQSVCCLIYCLV